MKAEVVSIGSELTSGRSLDTNSHWLSQRLGEAGIPVCFHSTVADDLKDMLSVFQIAVDRADLIVVTGGLGPTADDLTREALARLAGVELVFHPSALEHIRAMFERRGRKMIESNRQQAYFPAGGTPIPNPRGTAPGIWLEVDNRPIVCLPGVPAEMRGMLEEWALPRIRRRFGSDRVIVHRTLRCYGGGESAIEERLGDLTQRGRQPEVGITASEATISLRITAAADSSEEARLAIEPVAQQIYHLLGELVFGEDDDELQTVVARLLAERDCTLSTAESCTGGLVGHLLTEVPGMSRHFLGGVVAYSNEAKSHFLGVPPELIQTHGAVSPQVAAAMATGCRDRFGSDLALGITGIAGPDGGTPEKPVGLVYVALAHAGGVEPGEYNWSAGRSSVKLRSARTALNLVRLQLRKR